MVPKICNICLKSAALQKKSHIIPKFFKSHLNRGNIEKYLLSINQNKKINKVQDLAWENYILCPQCEKRISQVENYCAQFFFNRFHNLSYRNNFQSKPGMIKESLFLNMEIFNLFVLSIVLRCSICNRPDFKNFNIPSSYLEKMRNDLNLNLLLSQSDYNIDNQTRKKDYFAYNIQTRKNLSKTTKSPITACPSGDNMYSIFLGDYIITFFLSIPTWIYEKSLNRRNDTSLKIWEVPDEIWEKTVQKLYLSLK